jgi:hypothetical protein
VPAMKDKTDPMLARMQTGDSPLMREDRNKYATEMINLTRHLLGDEISNKTIQWYGEQTDDIARRLRSDEEIANNRKQTADGLRKRLPELDKLEKASKLGDIPELDEAIVAKLFRSKLIAENAYAVNDFVTATQLLRDLLDQVDSWSGVHKQGVDKAAQDWGEASKGLPLLLDKAEILTKPDMLPEKLRKQAEGIVSSLRTLVSGDVGTGMGYIEAMKRLNRAKSDFKKLEDRGEDVVSFDTEEPNKRVESLLKEVETQIGVLDKELRLQSTNENETTAIGKVLEPLMARLSDEELEWRNRMEQAFDTVSLDEALTTKNLKRIKDDAQKAATGPGLVDSIAEMKVSVVRPAYDEAREKAVTVAERLMSSDVGFGTEIMKQIELMDAGVRNSKTPTDFLEATKDFNDLVDDCLEHTRKIESELEKARQEVDKLIAPVAEQLKSLKSNIDGMKSVDKRNPYEALYNALLTQNDTVRALRGQDQIPVLQQALDEARLLVSDLDDALAGASGKKQKGKMSPDDARKMLEKYKRDLADKDVRKYMAMTAYDISEKIEAVEKTLGDQGMAKMREQMAEIAKLVEQVEKNAETAKTRFKAIEDEVSAAKKVLSGSAFSKAPEYKKATEAKLAKLSTDGCFEGGHDDALKAIKELIVDLNRMAQGPTNLLGVSAEIADNEERALQSTRDAEVEKKKWVTEVAVLEKQLNGLKGNTDEISGLKTTLKEAKEAAEKSGDFSMGRDQLQSIRARMALVSQNPFGLAIASRNKLPRVNARWKNAFKGFQVALIEVRKAVGDIQMEDKDRQQVDKELTEVRGLFNPAAFESTVAVMAKKENDEKARSAAREVGLREARRMMAYIASDFRLRELMGTPLSKTMRGAIAEMNLALLDIENNMLVSM